MLVDVNFKLFMPSVKWERTFEENDFDAEKTEEKHGSPFVSNQIEQVKLRNGVYITGLNPDSYFEESKISVHSYTNVAYRKADEEFQKRKEQNLPFISISDLVSKYSEEIFGHEEHICYGVCDSYEQILETWPHLENGPQRHFITLAPIYKNQQPDWGGWRWSKWGEYIGTKKPTAEYLYDEPEIEMVYVFHIYTLKKESQLRKAARVAVLKN